MIAPRALRAQDLADGGFPEASRADAGEQVDDGEIVPDGGAAARDGVAEDAAQPADAPHADAFDDAGAGALVPAPAPHARVQQAPAATTPSALPSPSAPAPAATEVTVRAQRTKAQALQESAEAVNVVDTKKAQQQTADLGEVLARTQGVGVRRLGGLGSNTVISLNGLQGDQVRLFVDGVPMTLTGYPFDLANIPVNLVERVEIYRGVVPIRFGADALGGAINVVTDQKYYTHLGASYQVGSYGLHRAALSGRYKHEPSGFVAGVSGYLDSAKNDFMMSGRELWNPDGTSTVRSVRRFHDAYFAYGGNVELGVVDKKWARRLLVQVFGANYDKELQHNAVMSVPYGEATYGEKTYGATARYEVDLSPKLSLEALASYAYRDIDFRDMATHTYNWLGEREREVGRPNARGEPARGEIDREAVNQSIYDHGLYGRLGSSWAFAKDQALRLSVSPSFVTRFSDDHVTGRPNQLGLTDTLLQLLGGGEYELDLFAERLSNIAFVKGYYQRSTHESRSESTVIRPPPILHMERDMKYAGAGDGLRYRFTPWLLAKASYEYAIRLPRIDELFGNGVLVESNAGLKAERSHNVNLGLRVEHKRARYGDVMLDVNGFVRDTKDQIILLAGKQSVPYANISDALGLGVENAAAWVSPRVAPEVWFSLEGTFTYQDIRNVSDSGPFQPFKGMRIPSRPYMFASWGARSHVGKLPRPADALEPFYYGRYVHEFYRGWAEIGETEYKIALPAQVRHDLGITYSLSLRPGRIGCTFEVDNLTDAELYDVFGVQLPGRSFNLKVTGQI